jgi:UDP-N-acetyl-D-galactosamine dehydrogenase
MKDKISIIGLGYVGLPLAVSLSDFYHVYGFEVSTNRIEELKKGIDKNKEISKKKILNKNLKFINIKDIENYVSDIFIVTVPTPVYANFKPNLTYLYNACKAISKILKKDNLIIIESTVAPGTTEKFCVNTLSKFSKIPSHKINICFSPERANPGDNKNILSNVTKVISGNSKKSIKRAIAIYKKVVKKIHVSKSIMEAELSKIIENAQRDLNISFMNELMRISEVYGLDYNDVLQTCKTKWNFIDFKPGLVGGHCVSVDPYYLIEDLKKKKFKTTIISRTRNYNEKFVVYIAKKIIEIINKQKIKKILFYGISFKDNVLDLRNSKYLEIINIISKKYKITAYLEKNQKLFKKFDSTYLLDINKYNIFIIGSKNNQTKKIIKKIINKRSNPKKIVISLFDENKYFKKKVGFFKI